LLHLHIHYCTFCRELFLLPVFFFNDPATTEIYTLSLHDALPISFRYANNGKVLLGCRRRGTNLSIQVIVNGPGIPEDKQQEVFEQFTQLSTQLVGPKGLGLGLNIAQSLANILGHEVGLVSKPEHGCLFSVEVPIVNRVQQTKSALAPTNMTLQGVGVLCIDNEDDVIAGMSELLTACKCRVFTATTAADALALYKTHEA